MKFHRQFCLNGLPFRSRNGISRSYWVGFGITAISWKTSCSRFIALTDSVPFGLVVCDFSLFYPHNFSIFLNFSQFFIFFHFFFIFPKMCRGFFRRISQWVWFRWDGRNFCPVCRHCSKTTLCSRTPWMNCWRLPAISNNWAMRLCRKRSAMFSCRPRSFTAGSRWKNHASFFRPFKFIPPKNKHKMVRQFLRRRSVWELTVSLETLVRQRAQR